MIESSSYRRIELLDTAQEYIARAKTRRNWLMFLMLSVMGVSFGIYILIRFFAPKALPFAPILSLASLVMIVLPVVIWNNPRAGLYIIVFCATQFMQVAGGFERDPMAYVPVFWNVSTTVEHYTGSTGGFGWLHANLAEAIMVLTIVSWLIRQISLRELHIRRGALFGWLALYIAFCCWGFVRGISAGGFMTFALTEIRAQFYFFAAYLMGVNLITDRKHAMTLLWILIVGIGLKSFMGTANFIKNTDVTADEGVLNHEDSLLMNILLFGALLFSLAGVEKRMKWAFIALIPTALATELANGRRAGIAAFVVAFPAVIAMCYVLLRERRKTVTIFIVCFSVVAALYLPVAWNASGVWALPARAIRSRTAPDGRDAGSDYYRLAENLDLKMTRDTSPWIGYGYGRPYYMVYDLFGRNDPFKAFLPHNGILWIWMRLGHIGFIIFWMFVATTLIRGPQILKTIRDPRLQVMGILAIATLLMLIINGEFDLSFANYRTMLISGTLLGILGVLPRLVEIKQAERSLAGLGRAGQDGADDLDVREVGEMDESDDLEDWQPQIPGQRRIPGWERGVGW